MKTNFISKVIVTAALTVLTVFNLKGDEWGPFAGFLSSPGILDAGSTEATVKSTLTMLPGDPPMIQYGFAWADNPASIESSPNRVYVDATVTPANTPLPFQFEISPLVPGQTVYVAAFCKDGNAITYYSENTIVRTIPALPQWGVISMVSVIAFAGFMFLWKKVL